MFFGTEKNQPVKNAGKIVANQRDKIGSHADIPGVEEAASFLQFAGKFSKKRRILVIKIRSQETVISKRIDLITCEYAEHG